MLKITIYLQKGRLALIVAAAKLAKQLELSVYPLKCHLNLYHLSVNLLQLIKALFNIMKAQLLLLLALTFFARAETTIPILDDDIGESIFQQNKPYLIYVCGQQNPGILSTLQEYCSTGTLCTILDSQNEMYEMMSSFVGMKSQNYLLLLDSSKFEKFTLAIDQTLTVQQIADFYSSFQTGTLARHFTSEDPPSQNIDPYLTKVVGLTYEDFLNGPAKVKVLFLYTENEGCSTCKDTYDILVQAAKAFPDRTQVEFGNLDLFKNEHKLLKEIGVPLVLVYTNPPQYVKLDNLQKMAKLPEIIQESLAFAEL